MTAIGDQAFANNRLTSVVIPNSVITIGEEAFIYNRLTSVVLPNSVTTIGRWAFGSNRLTSVSIPNSVTTIGDYAFSVNQLTSVSIPNSVTTIGEYAFSVNQLTSVSIPDSVTSLGDYAFMLNLLTSVDLPSSLTTIPTAVFIANKFTEIVIPDWVTTIGDHAFASNLLTRIEIPSSVQNIGSGAFRNNQLNPTHTDVYFTGVTGTTTVVGNPADPGFNPSFNPDTTLYYYSERGLDRITGGFDTPIWRGYNTVPLFKVTFETNGGSTIPAAEQTVRMIRDQFAVAPTTAPTRAGYSFTGWALNTAPNTLVDVNSTQISGDTTFQAVWNPNDYTVTFDTNGGSTIPAAQATQTISHGDSATAPNPEPTRTGYAFGGWAYATAPTVAVNIATTPITGNTDFIAVWNINNYTVTFDTNGGSTIPAAQATQTVSHGDYAVAPTTAPTRAGYAFGGWAYTTAPTVVVDLTTTPIAAVTTFTAVWNVAAVPTLINTATSTDSHPLAVTAAGLLALGALALTRSRKKRA